MVKAFKIILVTKSEDRRQLIIDCLNSVHHTKDEVSTARMAARARNYTLIEGILYKKGLSSRYLGAYLKAKGKTFYKKFI